MYRMGNSMQPMLLLASSDHVLAGRVCIASQNHHYVLALQDTFPPAGIPSLSTAPTSDQLMFGKSIMQI